MVPADTLLDVATVNDGRVDITGVAGVVTASNLHMLFSFVVGAYGTFLLARYLLVVSTNTRAASNLIFVSSAIAGGFYAFAGSKPVSFDNNRVFCGFQVSECRTQLVESLDPNQSVPDLEWNVRMGG